MKSTIYSQQTFEKKPPTFSISRIRTYVECSQKYNLKYIHNIKRDQLTDSLILGSLIHNALEEYYLDSRLNFVEYYLFRDLAKNLIDLKVVTKPGADLTSLIQSLSTYSYYNLSLMLRGNFQANAPIRTKAGDIPKALEMTQGYKNAARFFNLEQLELEIKYQLKALNPDLPADFSLPKALSTAHFLAYRYSPPQEFICTEIQALEFPIAAYDFSEETLINPFDIPLEYRSYDKSVDQESFITGFIDWVGKVKYQGEEHLAVVDYKSGKSDYEIDHLSYNPQLLFYALAYQIITKQPVTVIGIHNLRSNNLALVKVDPKIQKQVLQNFFYNQHLIELNLFNKHLPESKYSPCLNSFNKPCPYLQDCHPDFKLTDQ